MTAVFATVGVVVVSFLIGLLVVSFLIGLLVLACGTQRAHRSR